MNKSYKLVGYLNFFDIVPSIIYPIFADNDNDLYWAFSSVDDYFCVYYYTEFLKLPTKYKKSVKFFKDTNTKLEIINEYYQLGDLVLAGIELSDNEAYIGSIDKYYEFITQYKEKVIKNSDYKFKEEFLRELEHDIIDTEKLVYQASLSGVLDKAK